MIALDNTLGVSIVDSISMAHLLSTLTKTQNVGFLREALLGSNLSCYCRTNWGYSSGNYLIVIQVGICNPKGLSASKAGTHGRNTHVPNPL